MEGTLQERLHSWGKREDEPPEHRVVHSKRWCRRVGSCGVVLGGGKDAVGDELGDVVA